MSIILGAKLKSDRKISPNFSQNFSPAISELNCVPNDSLWWDINHNKFSSWGYNWFKRYEGSK